MSKRHLSKIQDLEALFLRLEELVLANSGADEFEEIYKLLIAKLWDEHTGESARFRVYGSAEQTFSGIALLLQEANRNWPGVLEPLARPMLTPPHLQVCVEALAQHTIFSVGLEIMDSFFEFLISQKAKGVKGQYFTPRPVVEFCVQMLRPQTTETILDPACGSGGFLIHSLNFVRHQASQSGSMPADYCGTKLWGFDIDPRVVRVAKTLMILAGSNQANIMRLNSLLKAAPRTLMDAPQSDEPVLTIDDVCRSRFRHHKGFDLVLTNPPFAGEIRETSLLNSYLLAQGKTKVERDVLFVERCLELLRPGGRMAMVLPHNKFAADSFLPLRQWLFQKGRVLAVVGLGRNTFLPHTHQKTSVLFIQKRAASDMASNAERTFFAVSEREGKNTKGQWILHPDVTPGSSLWETVNHDLSDIVPHFHAFCKAEGVGF